MNSVPILNGDFRAGAPAIFYQIPTPPTCKSDWELDLGSGLTVKRMTRFCLMSIVVLSLSVPALAQTPENAPPAPGLSTSPVVTFGVMSFLGYTAELHESNGYNAFDVTRGLSQHPARLSDRVRVRFTPDVRPTTDASLDRNLALRLEYASLDVQATDSVEVMFGLHETPWLTFEESVNRYRVLGPMFAERLELIPGATDLGASIKARGARTEFHLGVYNGEGYGRAEVTRTRAWMAARRSVRSMKTASSATSPSRGSTNTAGTRDRPRNVAIVMGSYENTHVAPRRSIYRPPTTRSSPWTSRAAGCRSSAKAARANRVGRRRRPGLFRSGRVQRQRLRAPADLRRRALESGGTRTTGRGDHARAGNSDRQLTNCSRRLLAQTHIEF